MDETNKKQHSDAVASRKRRSSILKSQRVPRTPLSELEFNVATPTDTVKSRRVSFSKRTGVAEFVTNEATTTWKNFYEEHNKSLESSGSDSVVNSMRPSIGHIGKHIFYQQCEEVEFVEFMDPGNKIPGLNLNTSLNVDFTKQLAALECTGDDKKLVVPPSNCELSTFTDLQSKLFRDDVTAPGMGEMSGGINVNFSAVQSIQGIDDLEAIQEDLEKIQMNSACNTGFANKGNLSEYIEIDINTSGDIRVQNEVSDMSITDTVLSPKVQEVSKSCSIDKKLSINWEADKENIVINPYIAPCESINFAVNEETDKVLVFDGKKLMLQSEKDNSKSFRQMLIPNIPIEKTPQKKTLVLDVNDDLPNFIDDQPCDTRTSLLQKQNMKSFVFDDMGNVSMSHSVVSDAVIPVESQICEQGRTFVYGNETGNISITQALPAIIEQGDKSQNRQTLFFENDMEYISMTEAISSNLNLFNKVDKGSEKRKTIIFENDNGEISMTEAISSNLNLINKSEKGSEKRKTIIFENDSGEISMTEVLPLNIFANKLQEKRQTILYENNNVDVSITQALTGKIVQESAERQIVGSKNNYSNNSVVNKDKTVIYENDFDMSITQSISKVILKHDELPTQRRKTIIYENNSGNISVTQAIPSNIILSDQNVANISLCNINKDNLIQTQNLYESERTNMPDRIRTIVYEKDLASSLNQPSNTIEENNSIDLKQKEKRKTVVYTNDDDAISITKAISSNIILTDNLNIDSDNKQNLLCNDNCDSMGDTSSTNVLLEKSVHKNQIDTTDNDNLFDKGNIEPDNTKNNISYKDEAINIKDLTEKLREGGSRRTVLFENDADMSISQPIEKVSDDIINKQGSSILNNHFKDLLPNITLDKMLPTDIATFDNTAKDNGNVFSEEKLITKQDVLVYQADTTHSHNTPNLLSNKRTNQSDLNTNVASESFQDHEQSYNICLVEDDLTELKSSQVSDDGQVKSTNDMIVIEKCSNLVNNSTTSIIIATSDSNVVDKEIKNMTNGMNDSILDDLLDMSIVSVDDGFDDKNVMVNVETKQMIEDNKSTCDKVKESNDSMFYITKDSDEEVQTENSEYFQAKEEVESIKTSEQMLQIENKSPLPLEYTEEHHGILKNLQIKTGELKGILHDKSSPKNRHYEKVQSSDMDNEIGNKDSVNRESIHVSNVRKSIKNADDTNDLLQLLSDFTDNKVSDNLDEEDDDKEPVMVKGHIALENKSENNDNRRSSLFSRRLSMVISREDILNNISMAHAALQKSKRELDETFENTEIETPEVNAHFKKTVRMSDDIVKKLHFDDDTESNTSLKSDKISPLKKIALGETSYMKDNKAKVIPTYLKDVSDGIKELMHDLVKPAADNTPFETSGFDKDVKSIPSTCSTQIQANLVTSSQIDVHTELYSNPTSICDILNKQSLTNKEESLDNQVTSHSAKQAKKSMKMSFSGESIEDGLASGTNFTQNMSQKSPVKNQSLPERVLVFDHYNPLNNVLLAPLEDCQAHKYNPIKSDETLCGSQHSESVQNSINEKEQSYEVERVSLQYNMESHVTLARLAQPSGDAAIQKCADAQSIVSTLSKPISIDQSIDAKVTDVKDIDVNTVIAMKQNKELLEASSSLTLVDNALVSSVFDIDIDSKTSTLQDVVPKKTKNFVKFVNEQENQENAKESRKMGSEVTSNNEQDRLQKYSRPKKRIYSPMKHRKSALVNLDVTPKPISKMQKLSISPEVIIVEDKPIPPEQVELKAEKDDKIDVEMDMCTKIKDESAQMNISRHKKEKSPKTSKNNKTGTAVTVHQLMTEYNIDKNNIDEDKLKEKITKALKTPKSGVSIEPKTASQSETEEDKCVEVVSSFTSSKNLKEDHEDHSGSFEFQQTSTSSIGSRGCIIWHPELECRSSTNVVAEIDKLPFMGSRECEWESSSGDAWSFRLLHARCRLSVRLGHRHDNASRSHVRADTPVIALDIEIAQHDKKNTVASACVRLGAEAMRYECGRGCALAGDVPALVRRCAAVARLALRWGRAMYDAQRRLAYTLSDGGQLSLKVANIPLRSVWEVHMRLELVVEDARQSPWPRAGDVRVERVVSDVRVGAGEVRRALGHVPADWGHVPRTLWRIFKHLKYKTREDEFLDFAG